MKKIIRRQCQKTIRNYIEKIINAKAEENSYLLEAYHFMLKGYLDALLDTETINAKAFARYDKIIDDIALSRKKRKIR